MNSSRTKGRSFGTFIVVLLVLLLIALLAGGLYLGYTFVNRQASATGTYSEEPVLTQDYKPAEFSLVGFRPVYGSGNSIAPVSYGNVRVAAGRDSSGNGVILQLSDNGTSAWAVNLGAPLINCSRQVLGDPSDDSSTLQLPCIYQGKESTGVALINLRAGTGSWIWQSADTYVNVGVRDSQIILIGSDLSISRVNPNGSMAAETLVSQAASDPNLAPDLSSCSLGDSGTIETPERLETASSSFWLITHNGVNYFVDPRNNQIQAALPGRLLENSEGTLWAVSPTNGCTRAAAIQPQRGRITLLPENVTVPANSGNFLPDFVEREGKLFGIDWESQRLKRPRYEDAHLTLKQDTRVLDTDSALYVSSGGRISAVSKKNGTTLWSFSDSAQTLWVHQDTLIYNTSQGALKAVSTGEGIELWSIGGAGATFFSADADGTMLQTAGSTGLLAYAKHSGDSQTLYHGSAAPTQEKATPGVTLGAGECVRVSTDIAGAEDSSGTVTATPSAEASTSSSDSSSAEASTSASTRGQSSNASHVTVTKVDCSLPGAQTITYVVNTSVQARGTSAANLIKTCLQQSSDTLAALSVNSPIVDANVSGLCVK